MSEMNRLYQGHVWSGSTTTVYYVVTYLYALFRTHAKKFDNDKGEVTQFFFVQSTLRTVLYSKKKAL